MTPQYSVDSDSSCTGTLKRQSLISEYFLYNPSQLQKNHLRL